MNEFNTKVDGLKSVISPHDVKTTSDRLEAILEEKGMHVFARINHSAGAKKIGERLRPTELIIFGNPKAGTPLMQYQQTIGIDLPQKILVWENEKDEILLSYNDPKYFCKRHGIGENHQELMTNISNSLATIVKKVTDSI